MSKSSLKETNVEVCLLLVN
uniref:Uncharacterized protein n=1 Tax=Anguilla anguilla TaxID=7936 RepID=A0A0E9VM02_ANGAN